MLKDKVVSHSPVFPGKGGPVAKSYMEKALRVVRMSSCEVVKPERFTLTVSHKLHLQHCVTIALLYRPEEIHVVLAYILTRMFNYIQHQNSGHGPSMQVKLKYRDREGNEQNIAADCSDDQYKQQVYSRLACQHSVSCLPLLFPVTGQDEDGKEIGGTAQVCL